MGRLYPGLPPFTTPQDFMPAGVFPLVICTTRERLAKMLTVLHEGGKAGLAPLVWDDPDSGPDFDTLDHIQDLVQALAYLQNPQDSPCYPSADPCRPPFWDDEDAVGEGSIEPLPRCEDPTAEPWYNNIADWLISSFLAATATPGAAIAYKTLAPKVRLALRTGPNGAPARVLVNGILLGIVDTVAPEASGLLNVLLDLDEIRRTHSLPELVQIVIEHAGA